MKTITTEYEENASESMFCQVTGLPQCVADRASDSLADGRQQGSDCANRPSASYLAKGNLEGIQPRNYAEKD